MARWIRFILVIALGVAAGSAYGWLVSPVKYIDTSPHTLRIDYKTDYVLMVAEAYRREGDLQAAVRRLGLLGDEPPGSIVMMAIEFAQEQGYNQADLQRMQELWNAVKGAGLPAGAAP